MTEPVTPKPTPAQAPPLTTIPPQAPAPGVPIAGSPKTPSRAMKLPRGLRKEPTSRITLAGLVASFFAGTASGFVGSNTLPFKTFDWILDHGIQGFMLVVLFFMGLALIRAQKMSELKEGEREEADEERYAAAMRTERKHYDERVGLERETRGVVEGLLREQIDMHEKTGALAEKSADAAREAAAAAGKASEAAKEAADAARRCAEYRNKL